MRRTWKRRVPDSRPLDVSWWRRGSGPEPVLRNSRNTCSRSVATCWWSTVNAASTPTKAASASPIVGNLSPWKLDALSFPLLVGHARPTDLSPKTERGGGERKRGRLLRSSPPSILCVLSSNFFFFFFFYFGYKQDVM